MKHVSEWSLALIAATLVFAVIWWNVTFGRTEYQIKTEREPINVSWLWGEW